MPQTITTPTESSLTSLQRKARTYISWFICAHIPLVIAVSYLVQHTLDLTAVTLSVVFGVIGIALDVTKQRASLTNNVLAIALMVQVMLLVALTKNSYLQIDMHMYFFACVGILTCLVDWVALICATLAVALHHLILNFTIPAYVFPAAESDFLRVMIHAVILIIESSVLIIICAVIQKMFNTAQEATAHAENVLNQLQISSDERSKLESRMTSERAEFIAQLAQEFEQHIRSISHKLTNTSSQVTQAAQVLSQTITSSANISSDTSSTAQHMSSNVNSVASAAEELSYSVKEISMQLQKTNQMVTDSTDKAQNADQLADALLHATTRVNDVMKMISDIAGQINLLALNATIESARAGDAGKGFAVVANEVKHLAGQTDNSISEIKVVIEEMQKASHAITQALSDIRQSVSHISGATTTVAAAVEEQSATTNEIARNMQSAAQGTQTISANLHQVSDISRQANNAATEMLSAAEDLRHQSVSLGDQVDYFLSKLRQM